ncbi:MAG: hypothetical protein ACI8QS_001876 [Planctomycetota bacterium]|jgi:hypothetical protein
MRYTTRITTALIIGLTAACSGPGSSVEPATENGNGLLESLSSLEGAWSMESSEGAVPVHFKTIAGGTVVHETMMAGTEHEMVNLYTVDGDGLMMTHYCATGNQPHMRATSQEGQSIAFQTIGVSGMDVEGEHAMTEMTLVIVDEDHVEQHWFSNDSATAGTPMVMRLSRQR